MKKILKITIAVLLTCVLVIAPAVTFAWFALQNYIELDNTQGSIITSYFHCGDGSEDNPFVITRPVHLWNLTMLYQLLEDFDTSNYYFQVGYDLNSDGDLELYEYADGKATEGYTDILDMSQYTDFVPIGTVAYPFNGTFNGNNFIISELTVIGSSEADVGVFGYVGADAAISNLYFDNLTIDISECKNNTVNEAHTEHEVSACYVGYLVGHCETHTSFENIYLNNVTISGLSGDTVQNTYGYFGYCADVADPETLLAKAKGEQIGFGGSVDMESLYNRIENLQAKATKQALPVYNYFNGVKSTDTSIANAMQYYYDNAAGSIVWYPYDTNDFGQSYNYLAGGIQSISNYNTTEKKTGYRIHSGNNYITNSGTTLNYTSYTGDNTAFATVWTLSNAPANNDTTTIYTSVKSGTNIRNYYIRNNNNTIQFSTTSTTWTFESNGNGYRLKSGNRYLRYNNGWSTTNTAGNATTFTFDSGTFDFVISTETQYNYDYQGQYVTYFPLITNEDSSVAEKNTGYVLSGTSYINPSYDFTIKSGDIRVSRYSASGTGTNNNLSASYNGTTKQLTNVYTINQSGVRTTVNGDNYERYNIAITEFLDSISGGYAYGLHFMDGLINKSNLITLRKATVNSEQYTNYQMPADSIDFTLAEKGHITFFAGTYFSGNDSFFSLHEITRDENQNIDEIREIAEIYASSKAKDPYIYKYADGNYSASLTSDYSLAFKTSQIKKQSSLTSNAIYYFEIPMNEGEYALGSVDGGTGAYLMYLDIGTNGGEEPTEDFGAIEYRSSPEAINSSVLIINYEQAENTALSIKVSYSANIYTIELSGAGSITIYLLDANYSVQCAGNTYNKIGKYEISIS